jgi:hypothetical protein
MHGHHAALRQQIIHNGENRLLDLAGVSRAADQDQFFTEVQKDKRLGTSSIGLGISMKVRCVQDSE